MATKQKAITTAVNKAVLFTAFDAFDNAAINVAEACLSQGIDTWALARPFAYEWAAARFTLTLKSGQRGMTFAESQDETNTARSAMSRLAKCFDTTPKAKDESDKPAIDARFSNTVKRYKKDGLTKAQATAVVNKVYSSK